MWTHKPGGKDWTELHKLIQSTNNKGLFVNVCIKIGKAEWVNEWMNCLYKKYYSEINISTNVYVILSEFL